MPPVPDLLPTLVITDKASFAVSSSLFDEVILLFHLFFDVFHVILYVVDVLDSLLSRRGGNIVEDLQNFDVLFL